MLAQLEVEVEVEVAAGRVGADDPTLAELLDRWLAHLVNLGRSDATLYNYRNYVTRDIGPALGSIRLSKLSERDLDAFYAALAGRGAGAGDSSPDPRHPPGVFEPGREVGPRRAQRRPARLGNRPAATGAAPTHGGRGAATHRCRPRARPDVRPLRQSCCGDRDEAARGLRVAMVGPLDGRGDAGRAALAHLAPGSVGRPPDQDPDQAHGDARPGRSLGRFVLTGELIGERAADSQQSGRLVHGQQERQDRQGGRQVVGRGDRRWVGGRTVR